MTQQTDDTDFKINGISIKPGTRTTVELPAGRLYTQAPMSIPVHVIRGKKSGPRLFISAAMHGDEINGVEVIRRLLKHSALKRLRGTIIAVPIVNIHGLISHSRYLPDRRDLNRSFPGSASGSVAARLAYMFAKEIIAQCDYGIDLHTAAAQRTNYPNVRGKLSDPEVRRITEAFGSELILNGAGPEGSFRREATSAGCPTICVEAGEPWKMEPAMVQFGVRGVRNVLINLKMVAGDAVRPPYQTQITSARWLRAQLGGILRFHVAPGQMVHKGQEIASNYTLLGRQRNMLLAPNDGIILGMSTLPTVKPGEPICHLGRTSMKTSEIEFALARPAQSARTALKNRTHLATSINQVAP